MARQFVFANSFGPPCTKTHKVTCRFFGSEGMHGCCASILNLSVLWNGIYIREVDAIVKKNDELTPMKMLAEGQKRKLD